MWFVLSSRKRFLIKCYRIFDKSIFSCLACFQCQVSIKGIFKYNLTWVAIVYLSLCHEWRRCDNGLFGTIVDDWYCPLYSCGQAFDTEWNSTYIVYTNIIDVRYENLVETVRTILDIHLHFRTRIDKTPRLIQCD